MFGEINSEKGEILFKIGEIKSEIREILLRIREINSKVREIKLSKIPYTHTVRKEKRISSILFLSSYHK
ncbi:hypothetical protein CHR53_20860 [Neobacillus mesonae]|uniref:Uncharacterized protein n=1 Tax=Neobacillus mesonae TaxID=1193713 RepID=A0A3Q9QUH1_9BACI|nr:hypothetical protein CHR53_20860 [Neobacillus mesonae]